MLINVNLCSLLKTVSYRALKVQYTATDKTGTEYVRLAFKPARITLNGIEILKKSNRNPILKIFIENLGMWPTVAKIVTTPLVAAFSYFSQRHFSFKSSK